MFFALKDHSWLPETETAFIKIKVDTTVFTIMSVLAAEKTRSIWNKGFPIFGCDLALLPIFYQLKRDLFRNAGQSRFKVLVNFCGMV